MTAHSSAVVNVFVFRPPSGSIAVTVQVSLAPDGRPARAEAGTDTASWSPWRSATVFRRVSLTCRS